MIQIKKNIYILQNGTKHLWKTWQRWKCFILFCFAAATVGDYDNDDNDDDETLTMQNAISINNYVNSQASERAK